MAVFRVERNRDYTVMSNHHLRNRDLTLKAKGLLSQMLSLPDNWDYTLAGLSRINQGKVLTRSVPPYGSLKKPDISPGGKGRDERGKMAAIEYTIYEQPAVGENPILENPTTDNPMLENPMTDNPTSENPHN